MLWQEDYEISDVKAYQINKDWEDKDTVFTVAKDDLLFFVFLYVLNP